jgi:hypothetical protein
VPREKIERAFDLKRQLKNIDKIFARVFPTEQAKAAPNKTAPPKKAAAKAGRKNGKNRS